MTAASTTPKKPAPRKPRVPADKKAPTIRPESTPEYKLMRPFSSITLAEQEALFDLHFDMQDVQEECEGLPEREAKRKLMRSVFATSAVLRNYAVDPEAYDIYLSGSNALDRATTIVQVWLGELGK